MNEADVRHELTTNIQVKLHFTLHFNFCAAAATVSVAANKKKLKNQEQNRKRSLYKNVFLKSLQYRVDKSKEITSWNAHCQGQRVVGGITRGKEAGLREGRGLERCGFRGATEGTCCLVERLSPTEPTAGCSPAFKHPGEPLLIPPYSLTWCGFFWHSLTGCYSSHWAFLVFFFEDAPGFRGFWGLATGSSVKLRLDLMGRECIGGAVRCHIVRLFQAQGEKNGRK